MKMQFITGQNVKIFKIRTGVCIERNRKISIYIPSEIFIEKVEIKESNNICVTRLIFGNKI